MPTRVCSTQAEWEAREELDRQGSEDFNRQMRNGTPGATMDGGGR